jgi:hypothetical protein
MLQWLLFTKWFVTQILFIGDNISLHKCKDTEFTNFDLIIGTNHIGFWTMDEPKVMWDDNTCVIVEYDILWTKRVIKISFFWWLADLVGRSSNESVFRKGTVLKIVRHAKGQVRATSHTRLGALDHWTSSTLNGGKGGRVQVRFTLRLRDQRSMWMQNGCKVHMDSILCGIQWIVFIIFYHVWGPARIEIHKNSIWLRARSHMTSHYLRICDHTTWFWRCVGMALGHFSWSRLSALVWSVPSPIKAEAKTPQNRLQQWNRIQKLMKAN